MTGSVPWRVVKVPGRPKKSTSSILYLCSFGQQQGIGNWKSDTSWTKKTWFLYQLSKMHPSDYGPWKIEIFWRWSDLIWGGLLDEAHRLRRSIHHCLSNSTVDHFLSPKSLYFCLATILKETEVMKRVSWNTSRRCSLEKKMTQIFLFWHENDAWISDTKSSPVSANRTICSISKQFNWLNMDRQNGKIVSNCLFGCWKDQRRSHNDFSRPYPFHGSKLWLCGPKWLYITRILIQVDAFSSQNVPSTSRYSLGPVGLNGVAPHFLEKRYVSSFIVHHGSIWWALV